MGKVRGQVPPVLHLPAGEGRQVITGRGWGGEGRQVQGRKAARAGKAQAGRGQEGPSSSAGPLAEGWEHGQGKVGKG